MSDNTNDTESKECPICSKPFFVNICKKCGYNITNNTIVTNVEIVTLINKEQLLTYAKQLFKENQHLINTSVLSNDEEYHLTGIGVGINRIINLIERQ